jgi:hypothetical protein
MKTIKPRNRLILEARRRKAGAHEKSEKARRRLDRLALLKSLKGRDEP